VKHRTQQPLVKRSAPASLIDSQTLSAVQGCYNEAVNFPDTQGFWVA